MIRIDYFNIIIPFIVITGLISLEEFRTMVNRYELDILRNQKNIMHKNKTSTQGSRISDKYH